MVYFHESISFKLLCCQPFNFWLLIFVEALTLGFFTFKFCLRWYLKIDGLFVDWFGLKNEKRNHQFRLMNSELYSFLSMIALNQNL